MYWELRLTPTDQPNGQPKSFCLPTRYCSMRNWPPIEQPFEPAKMTVGERTNQFRWYCGGQLSRCSVSDKYVPHNQPVQLYNYSRRQYKGKYLFCWIPRWHSLTAKTKKTAKWSNGCRICLAPVRASLGHRNGIKTMSREYPPSVTVEGRQRVGTTGSDGAHLCSACLNWWGWWSKANHWPPFPWLSIW